MLIWFISGNQGAEKEKHEKRKNTWDGHFKKVEEENCETKKIKRCVDIAEAADD